MHDMQNETKKFADATDLRKKLTTKRRKKKKHQWSVYKFHYKMTWIFEGVVYLEMN